MRNLFLFFFGLAGAAHGADRTVSPAEFEAMVTGKTLSYATGGIDYGAEEYLDGRRVRWSFLDGQCQDGEWYPAGDQVCFVYEAIDGVQCWQFYMRGGGLMARFENNPEATELYEMRRMSEPLLCLGPEVGV